MAALTVPPGTVVAAGALAAAAALPALVVRAPVATALAFAAAAAGIAIVLRLEWAVLLFVALAPFEDWANTVSGASVKLAGLLVFAAWALRVLADRTRPRLRHPGVTAAVGLVLICLAAAVAHPNGSIGVEILVRYVSFVAAFVVLVDALRRLVPPARMAAVFAGACGLAALAGLYNSVVLRHYRAAGPIGDANDFAFFLVAALPFALALRRQRRRGWSLVAVLLIAGVAGSLSRGAALALVVMALWGFATGHLRARTFAIGAGLVALGLVAVAALVPSLVTEKLRAKEKVADLNVVERQVRWRAAAEMTVDHPVLGLGPAGFRLHYERYVGNADPNPVHELAVAHQMYLEVSAELGLAGLVAFLAVLGHGYAAAGRAARVLPRGPERALAGAVRASLVGMAVAAVFLTEQYYLPIWLVPAMGVALELRTRRS